MHRWCRLKQRLRSSVVLASAAQLIRSCSQRSRHALSIAVAPAAGVPVFRTDGPRTEVPTTECGGALLFPLDGGGVRARHSQPNWVPPGNRGVVVQKPPAGGWHRIGLEHDPSTSRAHWADAATLSETPARTAAQKAPMFVAFRIRRPIGFSSLRMGVRNHSTNA
jgi:hypothetical protein